MLLSESINNVTVKFVVNRNRDDEGKQLIQCEMSLPMHAAERIDANNTNYDERAYERFIHSRDFDETVIKFSNGYPLGYDWYFEKMPYIASI